MTSFRLGLLAIVLAVGCIPKATRVPPPVSAPPPAPVEKKDARSHLIGSWESPTKGEPLKMNFATDGRVTFQAGNDFLNPGQWTLDEQSHELKITFPNTPNEKLDIFHMYIGDGVKAFNRSRKEVTYSFDEQTWTLNVAGWAYTKPEKTSVQMEPEPVLK